MRACRAERLATTRTLIASTAPSRVLAFPLAASGQRGPGGLNRVKGVGLAAAAPGLAVGPVNFDYFNPASTEKTGQVGSIGSGSFNPDLGDGTKALEPPEQFFVAGRRWGKGLRAQQGSQGVECRGYMNIQVGVDPTRHPAGSFYDGHGHPFLSSKCSGVARPFRIGVTGGPGLFEQLGPITLLFETGRAVIIFGPEEFGRRRSEAPRTSLQVRPNLLVLPKLLEACNQQVDPRRGSPYILIFWRVSP